MSLQDSLNYYNQSEKSKNKANTVKSKQSKKDKDLPLKLKVSSALATTGYYTKINVGISAINERRLADVTDVDVLAIRFDQTFTRNMIAVSCKSGDARGFSPAREIFYLRGVLNYIQAEYGVVAFSHKIIPPHLRDLGQRLNILALSGNDIDEWCKSLIDGLPLCGYFEEPKFEEYVNSWKRLSNQGLTNYINTDFWFYHDYRNLQNVIYYMRKLQIKINGDEPWHSVVIMDIAAQLCLTIFDLCHHIRLMGLFSIVDTTAAYLFGGSSSYKARRDLYMKVQQLLSSTGILSPKGSTLPPLEPIYTKNLAELVIRFIEKPNASILIPQILQDNIWRNLGATGAPARIDKIQLVAEKLSQDLLDFLKFATDGGWTIKIQ